MVALEERSGLFVLGAVGFKPFMVIVPGKRRCAGIGSWDRLLQPGLIKAMIVRG
jgi:hypothetical protein